MDKVLSIVVTYNAEDWIDYFLPSLEKSSHRVDVIIIDNCSMDNTRKIIKENYPWVELVENNINLGFGKANNIGFERVIEEKYDYAFLLNQDAKIEEDTIKKLINTMKKYPEYAILSPIHRSVVNYKLDENFSSYLNSKKNNLIDDFMLGNIIKDVYEVDFVNAALWLVSKECILECEGFDPIFPHYGEDSEFVDRCKNKGYRVGIVPCAYGNHVRAKPISIDKEKDFNSSISRHYVNKLLEYKRYSGTKMKCLIFIYRRYLCEIIDSVVMNDFRKLRLLLSSLVMFIRNHP